MAFPQSVGEGRRLGIRGIIFDVDGTLGDTVLLCYEAFRRTILELTGRRWSDSEIHDLFGPSEEGVFQRLVPGRWREALELFIDAYRELHPRMARPFPGLEEALSLLHSRNVPLAVVTGKGFRSASITLEMLDLRRHFERVEAGSSDGAMKPRAILKVVEGWGFSPWEVAYLGDSPYDMRAAREAGVLALAAAWASSATEERLKLVRAEGLDELFHVVEQFRCWVEHNTGRSRHSDV